MRNYCHQKNYLYKKGIVAQRVLKYEEVHTPYVLFADDDVYFPYDAVEKLYNEMIYGHVQITLPCVFFNHKTSVKDKIRMSIL